MESSAPRSNGKHPPPPPDLQAAGNGEDRPAAAPAMDGADDGNGGYLNGTSARRPSLQPLPYCLPVPGHDGNGNGNGGADYHHDAEEPHASEETPGGAQTHESTAEILAAELPGNRRAPRPGSAPGTQRTAAGLHDDQQSDGLLRLRPPLGQRLLFAQL